MDFEAWWLVLIPIIFGLGWIAARVDVRQILSETRNLPDSYFKGLNFLLNEDHDKAIDAFIEVAKLDSETTELHFALGNLFRRRGEIERAIRVHQSLLNRADLPKAEREHAMHEIAQDFLKAGLLDRAELSFQAILDTSYSISATRALIRIYESEHDWNKAIDAVNRLRLLLDEPVPQLVHYHCELAQQLLMQKEPDINQVQERLNIAENAILLNQNENNQQASIARVCMLRAQLAKISGNLQQERLQLESVLHQAPEYAGLVSKQLMDNYKKREQAPDGLSLLQAQYRRYPSLDLFNEIFNEMRVQDGVALAWDFARESLRLHPSLLGLDRLLEVELNGVKNNQSQLSEAGFVNGDRIELLHKMIHKHTQRLDRYSCQTCGFQAKTYYWQCPGCNQWETYEPKRLEEMQ